MIQVAGTRTYPMYVKCPTSVEASALSDVCAILYMTVKPTHGVYHPIRSPAPGTAWGQMLAIGNLQLDGGTR